MRSETCIVGAGLVGTLLSLYLAKKGYQVEVYERYPNIKEMPRDSNKPSVNITLCERGLRALDGAGVGETVRRFLVPVYGRVIHALGEEAQFQPYGNFNEALFSIDRNQLNEILLVYAQSNTSINFHFNTTVVDVDRESCAVTLKDTTSAQLSSQKVQRIFAADGAFSTVRSALQRHGMLTFSQQYLDQGYKELLIPATNQGWTSKKNALHFWPRGRYMLLGLPNLDGSFTLSLHMPFHDDISFDTINDTKSLVALFKQSFADVLPFVSNLAETYVQKSVSSMVTTYVSPWIWQDKIALVGDAAHSIVPHYGQGANAGFEDCATLYALMQVYHEDWKTILNTYEQMRKPNTDIIADLALEHAKYVNDHLKEKEMQLRNKVECMLNFFYPQKFTPLYSLISFSHYTYQDAVNIYQRQVYIIDQLLKTLGSTDTHDDAFIEHTIHALLRDCDPSERS